MSMNEVKIVQRTLIKINRLYCFVSRTISRNALGQSSAPGIRAQNIGQTMPISGQYEFFMRRTTA